MLLESKLPTHLLVCTRRNQLRIYRKLRQKMVPRMDSIDNHSAVHLAANTPRYNVPNTSNPDSAVPAIITISLPPSEDPLRLTFGLEFEFIVVFDPTTYDPGNDVGYIKEGSSQRDQPNAIQVHCDKAVKNRIVEVLRTAGLEVNNLNQIPPNYTKWTVDDDDSIDCPDGSESLDDQYHGKWFASIELITPKMPYCIPSMETVIHVLNVLQQNFTCVTNQSCGLHVHIGNAGPGGNSQGFSLHTLKTLAILATVFNRQFNSLHPIHRVANIHCRSPAQNFPDSDPWDMASTIASARTTDELIDMMSADENGDDRGFAINFRSLLPEPGLRTLEFRQHEATFDARAVATWLMLLCSLLRLCHRLTAAQLRSFVSSHAGRTEEEFGAVQLLAAMGLGDFAEDYEQRGVWIHPRMAWE